MEFEEDVSALCSKQLIVFLTCWVLQILECDIIMRHYSLHYIDSLSQSASSLCVISVL